MVSSPARVPGATIPEIARYNRNLDEIAGREGTRSGARNWREVGPYGSRLLLCALINSTILLTASSSIPKNPCGAIGPQGSELGGEPPTSSSTCLSSVAVSRFFSSDVPVAGVSSHRSSRWERIKVGTLMLAKCMLATPCPAATFHSGLDRVIVEISTNPSTSAAAIAPLAAEKVPMLVPTSQTGTLARPLRYLVTALISSACSLLMRKLGFIPSW